MTVLPRRLVVTVLLPVLLGAMLVSCAVHPEPVAPWQADLEVVVEHDSQLGPGSVLLKSIPGRLHGTASGPDLYRVSAKRNSIRIPADVLARQIRERAAILANDNSNPGELATPRSLGLSRIALFYLPESSTAVCADVRTGLELNGTAAAMLVYVDRPGTIRGTRYRQPWIMDYRLRFPAAGIYVLAQRTQGNAVVTRVARPAPLHLTVRGVSCAAHPAVAYAE